MCACRLIIRNCLIRENDHLGNDFPGNVFPGEKPSGKVTIRETTVNHAQSTLNFREKLPKNKGFKTVKFYECVEMALTLELADLRLKSIRFESSVGTGRMLTTSKCCIVQIFVKFDVALYGRNREPFLGFFFHVVLLSVLF